MRADGLWHPAMLATLAAAGHGDLIVVADAGLPVPAGVPTIDLLWRRGEPAFVPVLREVLAAFVAEHATVATELTDPRTCAGIRSALGPVTLDAVPHDLLKQLTTGARVIVRTGEATPYANVVLRAGVPF